MRFAVGESMEFTAGDDIPETALSVVTGAGQRVTKAHMGGQKQNLAVTQRLWKLPEGEEAAGARGRCAGGCSRGATSPTPLLPCHRVQARPSCPLQTWPTMLTAASALKRGAGARSRWTRTRTRDRPTRQQEVRHMQVRGLRRHAILTQALIPLPPACPPTFPKAVWPARAPSSSWQWRTRHPPRTRSSSPGCRTACTRPGATCWSMCWRRPPAQRYAARGMSVRSVRSP